MEKYSGFGRGRLGKKVIRMKKGATSEDPLSNIIPEEYHDEFFSWIAEDIKKYPDFWNYIFDSFRRQLTEEFKEPWTNTDDFARIIEAWKTKGPAIVRMDIPTLQANKNELGNIVGRINQFIVDTSMLPVLMEMEDIDPEIKKRVSDYVESLYEWDLEIYQACGKLLQDLITEFLVSKGLPAPELDIWDLRGVQTIY